MNRDDIPVDDYRLIQFEPLNTKHIKYGLSHAWDQLPKERMREILSELFIESVTQSSKLQALLESL